MQTIKQDKCNNSVFLIKIAFSLGYYVRDAPPSNFEIFKQTSRMLLSNGTYKSGLKTLPWGILCLNQSSQVEAKLDTWNFSYTFCLFLLLQAISLVEIIPSRCNKLVRLITLIPTLWRPPRNAHCHQEGRRPPNEDAVANERTVSCLIVSHINSSHDAAALIIRKPNFPPKKKINRAEGQWVFVRLQ